ncbi:MAG: ABC transporter ATP-binding protein [Desulfomonilaceae bacterium]
MSILELKGVSKDFSRLMILKGINLSVARGEKHAIIGPNGAGKTTLFNVISGKYLPSAGTITFLGKDITKSAPYNRNRLGLSRSFQINNPFWGLDVFENVRTGVRSRFGLRYNLFRKPGALPEINDETWATLDQVGLSDYAKVPARELSYGRQRALEIAMALSTNPEVILLDEPTAGMTREETAQTVDLINRVTADKTLIVIEHDIDVVFTLADTVTVLQYGLVLISDKPQLVRQDQRVKDAYLGND